MQRTDHTLRGVSSGTLDKLEKRESSPERLPPPVATCPPSPWRQAWSRHLERSPTTLKAATPRPALSKVNFLTSQALLLGRLALQLLRYFRFGWMPKFAGLACYATLLMPAFVQIMFFYYFSPRVRRGLSYGDRPRNFLDIYFPPEDKAPAKADAGRNGGKARQRWPAAAGSLGDAAGKPVVVFVTGGMWIIGYRAWGALLAKRLSERGIIVAALDYRNFPQGTVSDMTLDVSTGIAYVMHNCEAWGGDPKRVTVVGQSAGAHLTALALLRQAEREAPRGAVRGDLASFWPVSSLVAFVGVSGVYGPESSSLLDHFHRKGLYREVMWAIMEAGLSGARAAEALPRSSPLAVVLTQQFQDMGAAALLPPVLLCHGTADASTPVSQSEAFGSALRLAGLAKVEERYYQGKTHTDPFLEDPILGGRDELLDDVTAVVQGERRVYPPCRRLLPRPMVMLARKAIPF